MIVDYVLNYQVSSDLALKTARYTLFDALGCGFLALGFPECTKHLGPIVPGTVVPNGCHVPGTPHVLDPVMAAFNISGMNRWLDYNDTILAAEWGHPSDNIGAVLAVAEYVSRTRIAVGKAGLTMKEVLDAITKAHEIQGVLSLANSFNKVGLDHVILVRIASTAVAAMLLGANREQALAAVSNAWIDGGALRTYRHKPNTGSRKSWAAGDAASRAVRLAMIAMKGEMGYPTALSAPGWGFYDVLFKGNKFQFERPMGEYIMENVLFKVSFPAEFHAQTAVECAVKLYPAVKDRLDDIKEIHLVTHESAMRIINKTGPLSNPADRDHCLQYMVAIPLMFGTLEAEHYEDSVAADPRVDALRSKMIVSEDKSFSVDYMDPEKRSIANSMRIVFNDGSETETVTVHYPIGHKNRRDDAWPLLRAKFAGNVATAFSSQAAASINALAFDVDMKEFQSMSVIEFMAALTPQ